MVQLRTQCPKCGAQFVLPKKALSTLKAKARCNQCQNVFFVNDYIRPSIDSTNSATTDHDEDTSNLLKPWTSASVINDDPTTHLARKTQDHHLSADDIAAKGPAKHQLTEGLTNSSPSLDAPSLDEVSLGSGTLDDHHLATNTLIDRPSDQSRPAAQPLTRSHTTPHLSSVNTSTSSHSSSKTSEDKALTDTWLNDIISEDKTHNSPTVDLSITDSDQHPNNKEDLSQLLADFGVPSVTPATASQAQTRTKINAYIDDNSNNQSRRVPRLGQSSLATLIWALGCISLILLLFAQYVIFNLDTLIKNPNQASRLQSICQMASCSLPSAELSELRVSHTQHRPSRINDATTHSDIMTAMINRGSQDQLFPNIKVRVFSKSDLIGEFVARPDEYLTPPQRLIVAGQVQLIMFTVPIEDAKIEAIDIDMFY